MALLLIASMRQFALARELSQPSSGSIEIDDGWAEHEGDRLTWANPEFDDRSWEIVDLENLGSSEVGSRWFRRHISLDRDRTNLNLLIAGGDGTYELYLNGAPVTGTRLRSSFAVSRPAERVFPLRSANGDFAIALRTRVPASYAAWHLPQFMNIAVGPSAAIRYERQALESVRLYPVAPSAAINLLLMLAGIGALALALYLNAQTEVEYLFLGFYLFLQGLSGLLSTLQLSGTVPLSVNFLIADPLIYIGCIFQIEFTFSFIRRRVGWLWRVYEVALIAPLLFAGLTWIGEFPSDRYVILEASVTAPVGVLLSVLLLVRYVRGSREAAWLIIPSLAPAISNALFDLGTASILLGWGRLDFLADSISAGAIPLQITDLGALAFFLFIAIVMLLRYTAVSREQARSSVEFETAREIQRYLVSAEMQAVENCRIETVFLPAQEVGGDFYQILPMEGGATLIVIGDVSGKGLKAALTGALAIGAIRTLISDTPFPAEFLRRMNRALIRAQQSGFVTCLCARIGPCGEVRIANAGHLSPYLNGVEMATGAGLPLGLIEDAAYTEIAFEMSSSSVLTLLSDGVVEARNPAGELFGFERTQSISRESADSIAKAAKDFGQEDDITVVEITFLGAACTPPTLAQ